MRIHRGSRDDHYGTAVEDGACHRPYRAPETVDRPAASAASDKIPDGYLTVAVVSAGTAWCVGGDEGDGTVVEDRARQGPYLSSEPGQGLAVLAAGGHVPDIHPSVSVVVGRDQGDGATVEDGARYRPRLAVEPGEGVTESGVEVVAGSPSRKPFAGVCLAVEPLDQEGRVGPRGIEGEEIAAGGCGGGGVQVERGTVDSRGLSCLRTGSVLQVRREAVWSGVDQVFGDVEDVVDAASGGGVRGEVVEGIRVAPGPVAGGVAAIGDAVSEGVDECTVDGGGVGAFTEVSVRAWW
ncbi:hypothetical protein ABZY05_33545 [Streptomyces canus]|uniref:hypothetical protein n=1 Tax=Streptomyces canus TaxID=58343 RepID=UPI0033B64873